MIYELNYRATMTSVDDRLGRSTRAGDRDGFALEVDVLVVDPGGDEDGVAVTGGVDSSLDGWLIARNMDGARASRDCTDQEENEAEKLKNRRTRRTDSHGNVWSKIASSVRAEAF